MNKKKKGEVMKKDKVDFDLSVLTLSELINLYEKTTSFINYLEERRIQTEEKGSR